MSDTENTEDEEQQTMFVCKKCPNQTFHASEKDAHRQYHRDLRNIPARRGSPRTNKPGPKSKTKMLAKGKRAISPTPSAGTLFSIANDTDPKSARNRQNIAVATARKHKANSKNKQKTNGG